MSILLGILLTLIIFTGIVFVHELGHFLMARMTGTRVEEFGIGLPPKVVTLFRDTRGTAFTINWLPIGGFVRIHGENPGDDDVIPDSFTQKSWFQKSLILLAGVAMNFLLAYIIFFFLFLTGAKPLGINPFPHSSVSSYFLPSLESARKTGFLEESGDIIFSSLSGSLAERAGVGREERFRGIVSDGNATPCSGSSFRQCSPEQIIHHIENARSITLSLEDASGSIRSLVIAPEGGKIGSFIGYEDIRFNTGFTYSALPLVATKMAGEELIAQLRLTAEGFGTLIRGAFFPRTQEERTQAVAMVSGPIGIGGFFVQAVDLHIPFSILLLIIAMISLSLGFFNLIPFPGLDGGRFVTTSIAHMISFFTGDNTRFIRIESWLNSLSMMLLLGLSLLVAFSDIMRFFH